MPSGYSFDSSRLSLAFGGALLNWNLRRPDAKPSGLEPPITNLRSLRLRGGEVPGRGRAAGDVSGQLTDGSSTLQERRLGLLRAACEVHGRVRVAGMEMYQVRYFLSVARTLNFTRAAGECDVAQPSLSRAIKQLEAELGGELFRRERPQAILTELGQRMLPILTRCNESASNATALAAAVKKREAGALRVALSFAIDLGILLPHLHKLGKLFGGLTLSIRRGSAAETMEALKTGDAEIAIAAAKNEEDQSLESWPLFDEGFLLSCSRTHRFANRASVVLADLRSEQLVLARHGEHSDTLTALLRKEKVQLERCHEVFSDEDLNKLIAGGAGVAIVPRGFPPPDDTASIPIEGLDLRRIVYLLVIAGRPRTAVASTFMNFLRAADWRA